MNAKSPSGKLGTKRHKYATKLKSTSPKCETTVEGGAPAGRNGVDSTTYSNERSLTRLVSINLAREASMGQLNPDSPARLDQGGPIGLTNGIGRSGGDGERDPATEAAITLTDCFLRRESSLEKLGLLKRESSLGGAAVKRTNR